MQEQWQIDQLKRRFRWGEVCIKYPTKNSVRVLEVSQGVCDMFGCTQEEFDMRCADGVDKIMYMYDYQELMPGIVKDMEENGRFACKCRMYCKNRELLWVWAFGELEKKEGERPVLRIFLVDIHETETLRRERDALGESLPQGYAKMLITKKSFYVIEANKEYLDVFHTTRDEYVGSSGMFIVQEDYQNLRDYLVEQARTQEKLDVCFRVSQDSKVRHVRMRGSYYEENEDGKEYIFSIFQEEKKRPEKEGPFDSLQKMLYRGEKIDIYNVLRNQMVKQYEMVLAIDVETGKFQGMFFDHTSFSDTFPMIYYDEFVRVSARSFVHPEERAEYVRTFCLQAMIEKLNEEGGEEQICFLRTHRADEVEYRYKCVRYSYFTGRHRYIIVTSQDAQRVRETQLLQEDADRKVLKVAMNQEQETKEMRRNFLQMISRELAEPIDALNKIMRGWNDEREENRRAKSAVRYLSSVIQNIREYEMLEQGRIEFEKKKFSLDETLWRTFYMWDDRLADSDVEFSYQINLNWNRYYGDANRFARLINHVMGNCNVAVGGRGRISVIGKDEDMGNGMSHLIFRFEDDGIAVNEEFFGRNYVVDPQGGNSCWQEGRDNFENGFSLVVARKYVTSMGGTMKMSVRQDDVNQIEIVIPMRRNEEGPDEPKLRESNEKMLLKGRSLLVVKKDSAEKRLGPMLKIQGAQVDIAESGLEALRLWLDYPEGAFDAIILEGNPVDMDFLEFAGMIRSQVRKTSATIPIILYADDISEEMILESMRFGINAILPTSSNLERLHIVLESAMHE